MAWVGQNRPAKPRKDTRGPAGAVSAPDGRYNQGVMMSPLMRTITTIDQLLAAGDIGQCELVRGELHMMSPAGANHGGVAAEALRIENTKPNTPLDFHP